MKAALIGAGQIARQHFACLKTLPAVELAASEAGRHFVHHRPELAGPDVSQDLAERVVEYVVSALDADPDSPRPAPSPRSCSSNRSSPN